MCGLVPSLRGSCCGFVLRLVCLINSRPTDTLHHHEAALAMSPYLFVSIREES